MMALHTLCTQIPYHNQYMRVALSLSANLSLFMNISVGAQFFVVSICPDYFLSMSLTHPEMTLHARLLADKLPLFFFPFYTKFYLLVENLKQMHNILNNEKNKIRNSFFSLRTLSLLTMHCYTLAK